MSHKRMKRMARLVSLRLQQKKLKEAEHAAAEKKASHAYHHLTQCQDKCTELDRQLDDCLVGTELTAEDLVLFAQARTAAMRAKECAHEAVLRAEEEARELLGILLCAHKEHRSMEIIHEKVSGSVCRERACSEQREIDDIAQRFGEREKCL